MSVKAALVTGGLTWLALDMVMGLSRADRHIEYSIASAAFGLALVIIGTRKE